MSMALSLLLVALLAAVPSKSETPADLKTLAEACARLPSQGEDFRGTQAGLTLDARCKAHDADKKLNELYGEYRKRLTPKQRELLKQAQRSWLEFRKNWCDFISTGTEGGSAQAMIGSLCHAQVTEARIKEVEVVNNCQEGDLSCPAWRR